MDDGRGDDGESFYEILESWTTRKVDFKNSNSGKSSNKVQTPAGFSIKQDIIFCSTTRNVGEMLVSLFGENIIYPLVPANPAV